MNEVFELFISFELQHFNYFHAFIAFLKLSLCSLTLFLCVRIKKILFYIHFFSLFLSSRQNDRMCMMSMWNVINLFSFLCLVI